MLFRSPEHGNYPGDEDVRDDVAEIPNNRTRHDKCEGYSDVALRQIHFADLDRFRQILIELGMFYPFNALIYRFEHDEWYLFSSFYPNFLPKQRSNLHLFD